jgi:hypothetical protein
MFDRAPFFIPEHSSLAALSISMVKRAGAFPASPPQIAIKRALAVIAPAPETAERFSQKAATLKKATRSAVTNERGEDEGSYFGGWSGHAHQ